MKFHPIHIDPASGIRLPERMNNPFCYEPHPLCIMACKELQEKIAQRDNWREEIDRGKMFGVLIVEKPRKDGEATEPQTGYIAAYSGQIGGRSDWSGFVPAVFDYLKPDGYFKKHESDISDINVAIHDLQNDERMKQIKTEIDSLKARWQHDIDAYQLQMKTAKAQRDARRKAGNLSEEEKAEMVRESQFMKAQLRRLKKERDRKTDIEEEYDRNQKDIRYLKQLRKELSDSLQRWLFSKFCMLNPQGDRKNLLEIFKDTAAKIPPAGSGECCEPKLLQYAYSHGYRPLQMAMFWWGESPKEEIRHHLNFLSCLQRQVQAHPAMDAARGLLHADGRIQGGAEDYLRR